MSGVEPQQQEKVVLLTVMKRRGRLGSPGMAVQIGVWPLACRDSGRGNSAKEREMERIKWYFKQLLPLRYESTYTEAGHRWLTIWRMWFGRCYNVRNYKLA